MEAIKAKDIAIYGVGGLGREIACVISEINASGKEKWNLIGFFDDGYAIGEKIESKWTILGGINELNAWEKPLAVVLCFGAPNTRCVVRERIVNDKIYFPNVVHPSFKVADPSTFNIGEGNIIAANCTVTCNVSIGNQNLLNGSVVIGHDTKIGSFNSIMPNVRISGEVRMGDYNLIGACSFVLQQLKIGNKVTLSPGSILLTKPKDGCVYIGNPAKKFKY